ncbi:MbnB/TglH/ChrH family RiPP precursor modification enzyme [Chitinimonas naiadis]
MSPTLPAAAGLGLRLPHIRDVIERRPDIAWFEVHPENYFGGGANLAALRAVRDHYPLSLHGVGMGLGSAAPLDPVHLAAFRRLIDMLAPASVSEHLCWNRTPEACFNDLLPLPYSEAALNHMADRVSEAQDALGRELLIENLSSYITFADDAIPEGEFLAELVRRTGCGLLLDLNNLHVNEHNLGRDPHAALAALPAAAIGEIHIAGYEERDDGLWLDTHGTAVRQPVWDLLDSALQRYGPRPILLERDNNLPALDELMNELDQAKAALAKVGQA